MLSPDVYFVDLNIIYQIFSQNIWYISKILITSYILFYWLPTKIFPQEFTGVGIQKIVYNFIFMVAYVEIVVTFLIFIKIFTLLLLILSFFLTKLAFLKWYYKKDIFVLLTTLRVSLMLRVLNFFDYPVKTKTEFLVYIRNMIVKIQQQITIYGLLKQFLFFAVFIYVISTLISRGLYSYSDPVSDTSQFIEWLDFLQQNMLFWDTKAFGADFYGQVILIFFVNIFTNIDQIILFSLYPILLLMAMYFSIYFIVKDFSNSKYVAIFAVMIHGIVLMSPLSDIFLGRVVTTSFPNIVDLYGFKFYMPKAVDIINKGYYSGYISYTRYISALAYEHSSIFVLLNAYFLIKTLNRGLNRDLLLYALTLMLVFTFHGGGAIVLIVISVLIALNSVLFRKINISLLKRGLLSVLISSVIGNLWILSMIKYGIPKNFGAAAPFLDKLFGTARNMQNVVASGTKIVSIISIDSIHLLFFAMLIFGFIFSMLTKRKFTNTSFLLIITGIFITYFGTNAGLPMFAKQSRLAEYVMFAITLLFSFYFYYIFYKPSFLLLKKYARVLVISVTYALFFIFIITVPRWMDSKLFWKNINELEYTSIPQIILRINKENRPFNWTVVSYVQEYAKVKNKGFHINTQNFLLRYNPKERYLKVPTKKIFIFVENFPNPYKGMQEWYYRWRGDIQNSLKSWVAIYMSSHTNMKIYYKTKTVTIYEIDNSNYIEHLREMSVDKKTSK